MKKKSDNKEQELVEKVNENEYKKSLQEVEVKEEEPQVNHGDVVEEGWTNKQGAFVASQNGALTEAQQAQIDGNWVRYKKYSDGSYEF